MSITRDVALGFAGLLVAGGIATLRTSGDYLATETAIVYKNMPQTPNRVVVLTVFPVTDDPMPTASGVIGVQALCRGNVADPLDVDALGDDIYQLVQGLLDQQFGAVHVASILRFSSLPTGEDTSRRWSRSDKYHLAVDYPPTANRPD